MKRILFFSMLLFSVIGKCDTIDYYWAYYNDTVLIKLNQYSDNKSVHINKAQIKDGDNLSVKYSTDTPCFDCGDASIEVMDDKNRKVCITTINLSKQQKIPISMSKLLKATNKGASYFKFYYTGQRRKKSPFV